MVPYSSGFYASLITYNGGNESPVLKIALVLSGLAGYLSNNIRYFLGQLLGQQILGSAKNLAKSRPPAHTSIPLVPTRLFE